MSHPAVAGESVAWRGRLGIEAVPARPVDVRRTLQLVLAGIWLLDGILQYQGALYTKAFPQMLSATAQGNPGIVANPITWDASLVQHHIVLLNTIFATIQVLLGLGIAWRPTVRLALGASIFWALGVWWFGEGLGMVLTGTASPLTGAPGAVIIYALLAVLLWPVTNPTGDGEHVSTPFVAARATGVTVARALWLVLWLSEAYFALQPGNRTPQALHDMISGMENGQPAWLAGLDRGSAALVAHHGLVSSIVLAVVLAVIAVGVYLPAQAIRPVLVLALAVAAVIWVVGEAFGGILAGGATDPNSGLLLALLTLAYWPLTAGRRTPSTAAEAEVA